MGVRIQRFTMAAYGQVLALWKRSEGVGVNDADERGKLAAYLRRNPGMSFVARDGRKVVGAVLCGTDGRRGYLHHLAVDAAYRRRGIGRRLVAACLDALRRGGYRKCHLFVMRGNRRGVAFWKSVGWKLRDDVHLMSKDVGPGKRARC